MVPYTVVLGDTMWRIATKHGIGLNELLTANPQITNPSLIFPGQIINIPRTNTLTYTVISGDTMWRIAAKHGIELSDLMAANPQITNPALIFPGQKINIPSIPSVSNDIRALETEVIRLVNVERVRAGQLALVESKELSRIARIKSNDFIKNNYFAHNSPTYGSPFDMLRSFGITFTAAAENIASGQRSAAEVMNFWMNSSGHRTNILNASYNQIGVGVARDNEGNLFWTQMFIRS
jgi:uncharacterized YkwD family protein/spore coat assembly protein SafA